MIDDQIGKDDKNKWVNSKSPAFIRRIDDIEIVVGPLKDQDAVGVCRARLIFGRSGKCRCWFTDEGADGWYGYWSGKVCCLAMLELLLCLLLGNVGVCCSMKLELVCWCLLLGDVGTVAESVFCLVMLMSAVWWCRYCCLVLLEAVLQGFAAVWLASLASSRGISRRM